MPKLTFTRTYDREFVRTCLTNPTVWRAAMEDSVKGLDPELLFLPRDDNRFYYLKVDPGYGLLIGENRGDGIYEVHLALTPKAWGKAIDICKRAVAWFFQQEDCNVIRAAVPSCNHLAKRVAKYIGMESTGIRRGAFMRDGVAHDLQIFEVDKEVMTWRY